MVHKGEALGMAEFDIKNARHVVQFGDEIHTAKMLASAIDEIERLRAENASNQLRISGLIESRVEDWQTFDVIKKERDDQAKRIEVCRRH